MLREKLFVDYSGVRMEVTDPATGTRRPVEFFVAVLGVSNYTYVEASWRLCCTNGLTVKVLYPPDRLIPRFQSRVCQAQ